MAGYLHNYLLAWYHVHSMSHPVSTLRTRDDINGVRGERDPIERIS